MHIICVGGGHADLQLALPTLPRGPLPEAVPVARNGADGSFDRLVRFSGRRLRALRLADAQSAAQINSIAIAASTAPCRLNSRRISLRETGR